MRKNWVKGLIKVDFGIGVNTVLLAVAGAITVRTAREITKHRNSKKKESVITTDDYICLLERVSDLEDRVLELQSERLEGVRSYGNIE